LLWIWNPPKAMSQVLSQCLLFLFRHLLTGSRYTFPCNTFLAVLDTGPSLLWWSKMAQSLSVAGWLLSRTSCCW
jgi:hypothetical protein